MTIEPSPRSANSNGLVAKFLEWMHPYKEIAAIVTPLGGAAIGAVIWLLAHIATQGDLTVVKCHMVIQIVKSELPLSELVFDVKLDTMYAFVNYLASDSSDRAASTRDKLLTEIKEIKSDKKKAQGAFRETYGGGRRVR